jgi:hypothetical protein
VAIQRPFPRGLWIKDIAPLTSRAKPRQIASPGGGLSMDRCLRLDSDLVV